MPNRGACRGVPIRSSTTRALAAVLFAGLAALAVGACGSVAPYAAKVNANAISQSDLDDELRAIKGNDKYAKSIEAGQNRIAGAGKGTFDTAFVAKVLTRDILYELVHREVERRDLKITAADRSEARQQVVQQVGGEDIFKDFPADYETVLVDRTAEINALTKALGQSDSGPAAGDVRAYYDAHKADYDKLACAKHILLGTREQADAVVLRLAAGESFATVAQAASTDTQSAAQGGDLGCGDPAGYVPAFGDAVRTQAVGQVGAPVQTEFGLHVIQVTARPPDFEQVATQVSQDVQQQGQDALSKWVEDAVRKAKITVNPRYGTFAKEGQAPGVVPPAAPTPPTTASPSGGRPGPTVTTGRP